MSTASNTPGLPRFASVAIVGAGYMGSGLAQVFARAGLDVVIADVEKTATDRARDRILSDARTLVDAGLYDTGDVELIDRRVRSAPSVEAAVGAVEYVTEAVPEKLEAKLDVLAVVSRIAPETAIVATNTSTIPISQLSAAVHLPERFLGVHWMNPPQFIPGVELVAGGDTDPSIVNAVEEFIAALGKVCVRVADSPGFLANRLQFALYKEASRIVEEGLATARDIDRVVTNSFGYRLALFGPFAIGDMAGLDVYAASYATLAGQFGERFAAPQVLLDRVARGDLGMKSGGGFAGIDPAAAPALAVYRNRAYRELDLLRRGLGAPPGS